MLARHGTGPVAALRALASQVHPVFMLPVVASSLLGAALAGPFSVGLAGLHVVAAFFALYVAHVTDGYVDFHVRAEDDDHPLTARGCRLALVGASVAFFACVATIGWLVNLPAALLTLPGWLIAVNHAPQLDTNPVGATVGYPLGISVALLGGYYVQTRTLSATVLALAGVFLVVLSGIKVIDDAQDYDYDRSIGKRTVA
ncbi:MAG: UbiA family prenyltransferase, partial [Haloarculaceae archaeon]